MPLPKLNADFEERFLQLHAFIDKVIGPWATQSRISQFIAEDYDRLSVELESSFDHAVTMSFNAGTSLLEQARIGGRFSYLRPYMRPVRLKNKDAKILVNHGVTEQEYIGDQRVVHCYTTVFAQNPRQNWDAQTGSAGLYKDVQQDEKGNVELYDGVDGPDGNKKRVDVLWVSVGQPLRAIKWMDKYNGSKGEAIIRRYSVPADDYEQLIKNAVPEHGAVSGDTINVDVHAASDQFGLRGAALARLRKRVIPHSLVSYSDNPGQVDKKTGGTIRHANELRKSLGIPVKGARQLDVFIAGTADNAHFQNTDKFGGIADTLMNLYGVWWRNDAFLSEQWSALLPDHRLKRARNALQKRKVKVDDDVWTKVEQICAGGSSPGEYARTLTLWKGVLLR